MITIFTTAKPFIGQIKVNQINALKSWKALSPDVEVILFGNGEGYTQVAKELDLMHIPEVETSEQGTPLVNSMFALAQVHGRYPVQMYVNCDIILLDDLLPTIQRIKMDRFLMIGQRWDIDWNQEISLEDPDWQHRLWKQVHQYGHLHFPAGSDYFVYRGPLWEGLPTLVIGRAGYDNELIYHCLASQVPVIDVTEAVRVVHQNHNYGHHPQGEHAVWYGPEAELNFRGSRDRKFIFEIPDADWCLSPNGLVRNYCRGDRIRYLRRFLGMRPILGNESAWVRWAWYGAWYGLTLAQRVRSMVHKAGVLVRGAWKD